MFAGTRGLSGKKRGEKEEEEESEKGRMTSPSRRGGGLPPTRRKGHLLLIFPSIYKPSGSTMVVEESQEVLATSAKGSQLLRGWLATSAKGSQPKDKITPSTCGFEDTRVRPPL